MPEFSLTTPVAFLIFNRPDTTRQVFEEIRRARPRKLLVIADGPRSNHLDDVAKCASARSIIEEVDWDCEVLKNYSEVNLGCGVRPATGLDWVFKEVDSAIILEDDCLPHESFFRYCQELLEHYADDQRIMSISGDNFQFGRRRTQNSYYFSRYTQTCGWATWRRVWKHYDYDMKLWPQVRDGKWLLDVFGSVELVPANDQYKFQATGGVNTAEYWHHMFEMAYNKRIDAWDFQFTLACLLQGGLHILPNVNLISNIGYGSEATHTKNSASQLANVPVDVVEFPLQHPKFIIRDSFADAFLQKNNFG